MDHHGVVEIEGVGRGDGGEAESEQGQRIGEPGKGYHKGEARDLGGGVSGDFLGTDDPGRGGLIDGGGCRAQGAVMKLSDIRAHLHKAPFRPLTVRLTSGRTHVVEHPDYLLVPPVGDSFLIVGKTGDFHHIDADQVEEIEVAKGARKVKG